MSHFAILQLEQVTDFNHSFDGLKIDRKDTEYMQKYHSNNILTEIKLGIPGGGKTSRKTQYCLLISE